MLNIFTQRISLGIVALLATFAGFYGWAINASDIFAAMAASTLSWCF